MADRKIDTDQRIMDKAISMINEHGEESLSLRKLAQGIGLTTGAFYTHFSTKEELLQAVTVLFITSGTITDGKEAANSS